MIIKHITGVIANNSLLLPKDKVIVAVSGGIDSTALLHILHRLPLALSLIAVYIDHSLRPDESIKEIEFLRQLTKRLGIEFTFRRVDVPSFQKSHKFSMEEAARLLRYAELQKFYDKHCAQAIATGHTQDDQVEGMLIKLIRGSGLRGLAGMDYQSGNIIRPLLGLPKSALRAYLEQHGIGHCYDSSNSNTSMLRNRIRLELLPFLRDRFHPSIDRNLLQTMNILREEEALAEIISEEAFSEIIVDGIKKSQKSDELRINTDRFAQLGVAMQRRTIEKTLIRLGTTASFRQIETLRQGILKKTIGFEYHLKNGLRLSTFDEYVLFSYPSGKGFKRGSATVVALRTRCIDSDGEFFIEEFSAILRLAIVDRSTIRQFEKNTLYCAAEQIAFPLYLRRSAPGEKIQLLGAPGHKTINRILSDFKIPSSARHTYPVLASSSEVLAIVGKRIAEKFRIKNDTEKVLSIDWEIG